MSARSPHRGTGRRTTAAGALARVLRSEDVRATIPTEVTLKGGRVVFAGERREAQDNLIKSFTIAAHSTAKLRSVVTLRRDWYLVGIGIQFPKTMTSLGAGVLGVVVRGYLFTPRGRFNFTTSGDLDPSTFVDPDSTTAFFGPLGGRCDVDVAIQNTTAGAITTGGPLLVSVWGANSSI